MTLKNNIRESLLYYPSLFANSLEVMNHLFCVIGNGYEWKDGELVEVGSQERSFALKDVIAYHIKEEIKPSDIHSIIERKILFEEIDEKNPDWNALSKFISEDITLDLTRVTNMVLDIEHRLEDFEIPRLANYPDSFSCMVREKNFKQDGTPKFKWTIYPLCEYSKLCCIPDDIKKDYLAGAEKMIEFIKSHPDAHRDGDKERNLEWLSKAEARIAEIRKMREEENKEDEDVE
jgi:hypothetical protein